jgi:pseudouridine-5'-phosphate glycosidase
LAIAASMIYHLVKSRQHVRSRRTNVTIVKIIRVTVETGLMTATIAVLDLALFIGLEKSNYHIIFGLLISKLYSNSLMAVSDSH